MWQIKCSNEYGESIEGTFSDKAVAETVRDHLEACAKAGERDDNELQESFYGVYTVEKVDRVFETAAEWLAKGEGAKLIKYWDDWQEEYLENPEEDPPIDNREVPEYKALLALVST